MEQRSADRSSLAEASAKARHLKARIDQRSTVPRQVRLGTVLDLMERAIIGMPSLRSGWQMRVLVRIFWLSRRGTAPGNMATGRVIGNLEGPCLEGVEA